MRIFYMVVGILLCADTVITLGFSNMNFGVVFPFLLGIIFLLYGIFRTRILSKTQQGAGKLIRYMIYMGFWIFAATFAITVAFLAGYSHTQPKKEADALIVLGAAVHGNTPSAALASRLDTACQYLLEHPDIPVIVSGGQGQGENSTESAVMKSYLIEKGIEENRIIEENKSSSTYENFTFSKEILDNLFSEKSYHIIYVTNDFHLYRAGKIAEKAGLSAEGISAPSHAWIKPNLYVREYFALIKYYAFSQ